ncbi:MAG TPA: hypothetical protein VJ770_26605 [Stellaceae bacterium]|nr:hypothetical protein [Stellaceae bacterium]
MRKQVRTTAIMAAFLAGTAGIAFAQTSSPSSLGTLSAGNNTTVGTRGTEAGGAGITVGGKKAARTPYRGTTGGTAGSAGMGAPGSTGSMGGTGGASGAGR